MPRQPPPPRETHYIRWDEPGRRLRRALCGILVPKEDHDNEPTCADCVKRMHERERMQI